MWLKACSLAILFEVYPSHVITACSSSNARVGCSDAMVCVGGPSVLVTVHREGFLPSGVLPIIVTRESSSFIRASSQYIAVW